MIDAAVGSLASMDWMHRDGWTHVSAHYGDMNFRSAPAHYVFYTHTAETGQCHVVPQCCRQLRNIQHLHMDIKREYCSFIVSAVQIHSSVCVFYRAISTTWPPHDVCRVAFIFCSCPFFSV